MALKRKLEPLNIVDDRSYEQLKEDGDFAPLVVHVVVGKKEHMDAIDAFVQSLHAPRDTYIDWTQSFYSYVFED